MKTRTFKRFGLCCMPLAMLQNAGATVAVQQPVLQQAAYIVPADSLGSITSEQPVLTAMHASAKKFTAAYIDEHDELLDKIKEQNNSSFQLIRKLLQKEGLPAELVYMTVVESKMKNTATSYAGAAGIWQLMPATARTLGLKISAKEDQRRNIYKSTAAAARYLNDLYDEFDDWLLVIAAYNCGTGNVHKAIKKAGSRDFWKLQYFLPKESREHVKRFIAVHFYYEEKGSVVTMTKNEHINYMAAVEKNNTADNNNEEQQPAPASPQPTLNWVLITIREGEFQLVLRK
ncbi:transglycosylase-like protein with SLT domain [Lacibacter cauensis]|uniref:Transglycosylase-like protein with SLT domain n=1 Tax=Lacibacter cauensis TaxID=510947 RepID=A0A562SUK0_9BACT|nr:lytic transglycosylase domain-containing protein [Lacibacter cauensis]TWI84961.1 transglycosylase-like protein with SLT domain [Lacibacter cauensis]